MTSIFVSYSHIDRAFATRLAEALPALGIEPWIDLEGIHGGARWSTLVQEGLESCEALILILSPESMGSSNVHFQLRRIQHIDFHGQPFEAALAKLAESVRRALATSGTQADSGEEASDTPADGQPGTQIGPPTGTVTFLFTDIAGSTERWEQYPDAMPSALERHDDLMRRRPRRVSWRPSSRRLGSVRRVSGGGCGGGGVPHPESLTTDCAP